METPAATDHTTAEAIEAILDHHRSVTIPRLTRLWVYYRNPMVPCGSGGPRAGGVGLDGGGGVGVGVGVGGWSGGYVLGQEIGLPGRITGRTPIPHPGLSPNLLYAGVRREVVIENDIAWRLQAMVDFMFGKPVRILSTAAQAGTRARVDQALDAVWEASGGIALFQEAALLSHVFGWVDLAVCVDEERLATLPRTPDAASLADAVRIEAVDPRRGVPVSSRSDPGRPTMYLVHDDPDRTRTITPDGWTLREAGRETAHADTPWTLGRLPITHIQNIAEPGAWAGLSEVEPLIPLQDELNTRLSDRASRVTLQSFKMYLARGIDGFDKAPVAPGQVWVTDNPEARIDEFGGDASSPSEDAHIAQVREALDKISGVPPVAGGVVQGRIGNLSSANALRVTLMSVLAKTARKRVAFARGIAEVSGLILGALDWAGLLSTDPADRGVRVEWPDPLPTDDRERVLAAEGKDRLGVPRDQVLAELGYGREEPGVA
jgi:hypothetical protein